jgi:hypothetical protein
MFQVIPLNASFEGPVLFRNILFLSSRLIYNYAEKPFMQLFKLLFGDRVIFLSSMKH